jgi:hypothetical protein
MGTFDCDVGPVLSGELSHEIADVNFDGTLSHTQFRCDNFVLLALLNCPDHGEFARSHAAKGWPVLLHRVSKKSAGT